MPLFTEDVTKPFPKFTGLKNATPEEYSSNYTF